MALGRKLVAAGLSTSSQTAFDDALQQYGQVDRATRTELFERIRQHARDALVEERCHPSRDLGQPRRLQLRELGVAPID